MCLHIAYIWKKIKEIPIPILSAKSNQIQSNLARARFLTRIETCQGNNYKNATSPLFISFDEIKLKKNKIGNLISPSNFSDCNATF